MRKAFFITVALLSTTVRAAPLAVVDEHLGQSVPLDATFVDATGKTVRLGDVVRGSTPVVLVPAYFECRMLCGLVLKGVVEAIRQSSDTAGKDYRLVTVSFNPRDTPPQALAKQQTILGALGGKVSAGDWPFLTGTTDSVQRLYDALGYDAKWDQATQQFVHPAAIVVLTPDGTISRYLYGVEFHPRDFRLALAEARAGKDGPAFDRVLLTCFHYDPATRRYGFAINLFLRVGATVVALMVFGGIIWLRRRERVT